MRRLSSVIGAAVLLALGAQAVSADALLADGDGLAPVANGRLDLATICHEAETTAAVFVAVRATGHPNGRQVFENGTAVTTSAVVVSGDGISAAAPAPMLVMAPDWRAQPNNTQSTPVAWNVSVVPTMLGRYRATIEFSATGVNRLGEEIRHVRRMNVVGRVVDCAAPVFADVPLDVVVEAVASDGADVAYVPPTATDAVDGAVAVDCDLPPASRVPLGARIVTCTATDATGNSSSASFNITVVDTTAPSLAGMPSDAVRTATDEDGLIVDWPMPTAADLVDGPLPVTCDPAPGSLFAVGSTIVTCSATDAAGNVATAASTVEVTSPPPAPEPHPEPIAPAPDPSTDPDTEPAADPAQEAATDEATAGGGPASAGESLPDTRMMLTGTLPATLGGILLLALAAAACVRRARSA